MEMYAELTSSMSVRGKDTSLRLSTVKIHSLDTNWMTLENNVAFFASA